MTDLTENGDTCWLRGSAPDLYRSIGHEDVTAGTAGGAKVFSFWGEADPVKEARGIIAQVKDAVVAAQVEKLLATIRAFARSLPEVRESVIVIPPLRGYMAPDNAVLFEWIFPDFRIGFNIEPKPEESGWHIVSGKKLGEFTQSGRLDNMPVIVQDLLAFIVTHI